MKPIVCATRGGQASRRTQERAIELAKERGTKLIFICVVDPTFTGPMDDELEEALTDELKRLGGSLLYIAQARAEKEGVSAETTVQCGSVWDDIAIFLQEVDAETLVIGVNQNDSPVEAFGDEQVPEFVERLREETDVEIVVVT
jgi:nucleotide-binding universal stress UspA family protein